MIFSGHHDSWWLSGCVCVGSVLAQELDELSLFLLHPYLVNLDLVDWLWLLGFVPLLYEPYFYPCIDTQAWLLWWLGWCLALLLLPSTLGLCALICWNLSPCVCSGLVCCCPYLVLSMVLEQHKCAWHLVLSKLNYLTNTNILASVGVLLCRFLKMDMAMKKYFKS